MAAPVYNFKSMYFDKSTNSLIKIMMIDRVTVQYQNVNDQSENELTKEEVAALIAEGMWVEPPKAEPKKEVKATEVKVSKPIVTAGPIITAYIQSIKALNNNETTQISLTPSTGWAIVEISVKPSKVEVDLNSLDPDQIAAIMKIIGVSA